MEKKRAHYSLKVIKDLIRSGSVFITKKAQLTALESFGFDYEGIVSNVLELSHENFYKSMTSHQNVKLWHDVYKMRIQEKHIYIKLQILEEDALIISFKEDSNYER
ncbi:type II toxin-antitoxin system MqsR family toxin [Leptospira sp. GIMC2001]|uniref:type II toxin-antitoxin system MqsR family toxin n=1 Tax=Leptospira sp. GIMC2001 TaxID=1513297 RepID=UPI002349951A|nr:type II toxin-antitoxin system MqsR family toxin [Leptospira sp. GIMC2001]WCL50685.1 type II toxin-antitoxin system MqsR family toxin [Leptospira sp. GIMC2001]WCL51050.1 type II toxin-antitoxin system MqsR family toxin [Leptospira sp. GIMC2001]